MALHSCLLRTSTPGNGAIVDLTEGVRSIVRRADVQIAVAVIFAVGSTVGVTTMEHEPGGIADLRALLERLVPKDLEYEHNVRNRDSNAHAHLRASLIGPSVSVPVVGADLGLGTWQQIVLIDFDDRPRDRVVSVQVVS